ncbi:hypothetical protein BDQ17DRAFT_1336795 [Cyathus striatus]|nr:hypothetical protein BDQ17DRAFT_1336795 [Cyathus striatus]
MLEKYPRIELFPLVSSRSRLKGMEKRGAVNVGYYMASNAYSFIVNILNSFPTDIPTPYAYVETHESWNGEQTVLGRPERSRSQRCAHGWYCGLCWRSSWSIIGDDSSGEARLGNGFLPSWRRSASSARHLEVNRLPQALLRGKRIEGRTYGFVDATGAFVQAKAIVVRWGGIGGFNGLG